MNTTRTSTTLALLAAAYLAAPAVASAATITFPNQGTWTLDNLGLVGDLNAGDGANDTYAIKLTYSSQGYTGGATDYIEAVAVKVSSAIDAGQLFATTAPGSWTFQTGGLDSSGCNGSGSGFACAQDGNSALTGGPGAGTTYSWTFYLDIVGSLFTTGEIKATFTNSDGTNAGNLSQPIGLTPPGGGGGAPSTVVPEPASLLLLGTGLSVIAARVRNRSKRQVS